jgi:hypothetical protein
MGILALCGWCVSGALGLVATLAMLGAVSCSTHAVVASGVAGPAFSSALSGAAALGALTLGCIFVGGLDVAVRVCSLGLASALLVLHLWLSAATAQDLAAAADRLTSEVLLPLKAAAALDARWDCVFHGPADALYMASAVRHAAAMLGSMRQLMAAATATAGGGQGGLLGQ